MAFTNLFRRHTPMNEAQGASYAYVDKNSVAETLLDELERQCQHILTLGLSKTKRNSEVYEQPSGLLASTYSSSAKRRSSVDYSWLTPQNNFLQVHNELYQLSDITKMELDELIRNVSPEDCTSVVNQFRRYVRSQPKVTTPENIIALFRQTLADYIDTKQSSRRNSSEASKCNERGDSQSTNSNSLIRSNRVLPKFQSEDEQHSTAELAEISLASSQNESNDIKQRSSTLI